MLQPAGQLATSHASGPKNRARANAATNGAKILWFFIHPPRCRKPKIRLFGRSESLCLYYYIIPQDYGIYKSGTKMPRSKFSGGTWEPGHGQTAGIGSF